jgi:hypothetical protein
MREVEAHRLIHLASLESMLERGVFAADLVHLLENGNLIQTPTIAVLTYSGLSAPA